VQPLLQLESYAHYTTPVCAFVALGTQQARRRRHIIICGQPLSILFFPHFHIIGKIFEKKNVIEHEICSKIFSTTLV